MHIITKRYIHTAITEWSYILLKAKEVHHGFYTFSNSDFACYLDITHDEILNP